MIGLVLAAQTTYLAAVGCVLGVVGTSSNPFTLGGSPVLIAVAIALLAASFVSAGAVGVNLGNCSRGGCAIFANRARALVVALTFLLTGMAATTALMLPALVVPFGGSVVAGVLAGTLIASAVAFTVLVDALRSLELCETAANSASTIAMAISVIGILVALIVASVAVTSSQAPPCTGLKC
jgi:hypothetical protein